MKCHVRYVVVVAQRTEIVLEYTIFYIVNLKKEHNCWMKTNEKWNYFSKSIFLGVRMQLYLQWWIACKRNDCQGKQYQTVKKHFENLWS